MLADSLQRNTRCGCWVRRRSLDSTSCRPPPACSSCLNAPHFDYCTWDSVSKIGLARALRLPLRSDHPVHCTEVFSHLVESHPSDVEALVFGSDPGFSHAPSLLSCVPARVQYTHAMVCCLQHMFIQTCCHSTSSPWLRTGLIQRPICAYSPASTYPILMT